MRSPRSSRSGSRHEPAAPDFACEGAKLAATLDEAGGATGLLIVSGGNEVRSGAWSGQAQFAARIAAAGFPVFRFDRRGVGDSEGPNGGSAAAHPISPPRSPPSAPMPELTRVVGLGNCDAASALMLAGGAGCDALVLANPWTIEEDRRRPAAPMRARPLPPAAGRSGGDQAAADRQGLAAQLFASLRDALRPAPPPALAQEWRSGSRASAAASTVPVAERDRTAQAFLAPGTRTIRASAAARATHSFVEPQRADWLAEQVLEVLRDLIGDRAIRSPGLRPLLSV